MSVWCLFDAHSVDGLLEGYSAELIDDHLRWNGFAQAMMDVGWLAPSVDGSSLSLPDFDTHNGQSAKRRAQDADRKREDRKTSASEADKMRTREEKRREEEIPPKAPKRDGFDRFWAAWPSHKRKAAKPQCETKWESRGCEAIADAVIASVEAFKRSDDWRKEGGKYIPAPLTWLNQSRWETPVVDDPSPPTIPGPASGAHAAFDFDERPTRQAMPPAQRAVMARVRQAVAERALATHVDGDGGHG